MSALVLLHPAMTGQEAHAWCRRHEQNLEILHRQGKLHLVVTARPHPSSPPVFPLTFACARCGWAGQTPDWVDTVDTWSPPLGEVPVCPRCDAPYPTLSRSP